MLLLALVIILAAGGILVYTQHKSGAHSSGAVALQPPSFAHAAGISCGSAPAWSPDGRYFAIVGTTTGCGYITHAPDPAEQVAIFAGTTSKLVRRILLTRFLPSVPYGSCHTELGAVGLCFDAPLWSPDGQSLAVLFLTEPQLSETAVENLLIVHADGSSGQTIAGMLEPPTVEQQPPFVRALWDLQAHTQHYATVPSAFALAQTLTWSQGGTLTANPASSTNPPPPIGIPSGGATFSPWQPGYLETDVDQSSSRQTLFTTSFRAWSPDGRYLATRVAVEMLLSGPGSNPPTPGPNAGYSIRAPRDAALSALVQAQQAQAAAGSAVDAYIAWDTTGAYLASASCATPTSLQLTLYATATGTRLASATLSTTKETDTCDGLRLSASWSPTGHTVLVTSIDTGGMFLWTPKLSEH
ncbi:MAG: hypothetical protein OJF49_002030 [Ktedonobacterales bacterium]|nr:MAG: hypothetical protein OJF49_002030 [Ktedonobacterales bacterium]